jgi:hypothetical protein
MKHARMLALFVVALLLVGPVYAQHRSSSSRPYYGEGKHTTSHGGHYQGEKNSHHKGGHYKNPKTNNNYGKHKP